MTWNSKVAWTEGLFLRPQHFQQADRYHEASLTARTRLVTPYPWGISTLELDNDLAQQGKFAVRRCAGIMPDGMPFDIPDEGPLPEPLELNENLANTVIGLSIPAIAKNSQDVDFRDSESASRFWRMNESVIDSTAAGQRHEDIEIAYPRFNYLVMDGTKKGSTQIGLARVREIQDKTIVWDSAYVPPSIATIAHATLQGYIKSVIGWLETRQQELGRYAADPSAGGGLDFEDYFALMGINQAIPVVRHMFTSKYVHPERLYEQFLGMAGWFSTFSTDERMVPQYPAYDHDDLEGTFKQLMRDLQRFIQFDTEKKAIRLELEPLGQGRNAFVSRIKDRSLFQRWTFIVEVGAGLPLDVITQQFPQLFKIGPSTRMNEIVQAALQGIPIQYRPHPPRRMRQMKDRVYFQLDRTTPLWDEFSRAPAVGLHFAGDWPNLDLEFWAVLEDGS